jgi:hypothetical protein
MINSALRHLVLGLSFVAACSDASHSTGGSALTCLDGGRDGAGPGERIAATASDASGEVSVVGGCLALVNYTITLPGKSASDVVDVSSDGACEVAFDSADSLVVVYPSEHDRCVVTITLTNGGSLASTVTFSHAPGDCAIASASAATEFAEVSCGPR